MARNIEIKAWVDNVAALKTKAAALATDWPFEIEQDDTFFRCDHGRLKLRAFSSTAGELIFYQRADEHGPKASFYVRSQTADPASLREALTLAYGVVGRVEKHRTVFLVGRTRVHVDQVHGLGSFLELEVVLQDGEKDAVGVAEAQNLMRKLGVQPHHLVDTAYVDLLARSARPSKP
jgi:predicted adenylyl cyclase CyaB